MKENMRHAITVKECSQVVENAHLNHNGFWLRSFRRRLNENNFTIYRLCWSVMNDEFYPTPQGAAYWGTFRWRKCYV